MRLSQEKKELLSKILSHNYGCSSIDDLDMVDSLAMELVGYFDLPDRSLKEDFGKTLFLGSGKHSVLDVSRLHKRLEYAITILGGLQQPGHPESEEEAKRELEYYNKFNDELKHTLKDIINAFGFTPEDLK